MIIAKKAIPKMELLTWFLILFVILLNNHKPDDVNIGFIILNKKSQ